VKHLKIIHISDLHYSKNEFPSTAHIKDKNLSGSFKEEIGFGDIFDRLKEDIPKIKAELNKDIDILACTGDLCAAKEKESLPYVVSYIVQLGKNLGIEPGNIFIIPGNHDVDRDVEKGPLDEFVKACQTHGVAFNTFDQPLFKKVNGFPIFCLNSSLGSREIDAQKVKKEYWQVVSDIMSSYEKKVNTGNTIKPEYLSEMQSLDIPAIGKSQVDFIEEKLRNNVKGNFSLFLSHHCPLPTPDIEVRPYGSLIDSGKILFSLTKPGRKIVLLHGHKHISSTSVAYPLEPDSGDEQRGMLLANGISNFKKDEIQLGYLEIITTDNNDFLCCRLERFIVKQMTYESTEKFSYFDINNRLIESELDIRSMIERKVLRLNEIKAQNQSLTEDKIAEELLKLSTTRLFSIKNMKKDPKYWEISINIDKKRKNK
jgi:3',5'-cyclic AMP phosphodiesterase CpdA